MVLLAPSCQHYKENLQPDKFVLGDLKLKNDAVFVIVSTHARRSSQCIPQTRHCQKAADFGDGEMLSRQWQWEECRNQQNRSVGNDSSDKGPEPV